MDSTLNNLKKYIWYVEEQNFSPSDMIFDTSSLFRDNPGNHFYNERIEENYDRYVNGSRNEKKAIAAEIVDAVVLNEGRFIAKELHGRRWTRRWVELSRDAAIERTKQRIRDTTRRRMADEIANIVEEHVGGIGDDLDNFMNEMVNGDNDDGDGDEDDVPPMPPLEAPMNDRARMA